MQQINRMNTRQQKILDEWWSTEPFGFDHPDTYQGICDVIDKILEEDRKVDRGKNRKMETN